MLLYNIIFINMCFTIKYIYYSNIYIYIYNSFEKESIKQFVINMRVCIRVHSFLIISIISLIHLNYILFIYDNPIIS